MAVKLLKNKEEKSYQLGNTVYYLKMYNYKQNTFNFLSNQITSTDNT